MRVVDTKGQLCPAPIIAAKKALRETAEGDSFIVLTDNRTSLDNLSRFLKDNNALFSVIEKDGIWTLTVLKGSGEEVVTAAEDYCSSSVSHFEKNDLIIVISSDKMGEGNEELGHHLMGNFIKAIKDLDKLPRKIVFYNSGVLLATNNSSVAEHLRDIERMGVELLLCATCVNFYNISDKLVAGVQSNMFAIAEAMASAGKVIKP
jgi:selenium metabolism protein YedF